jgi:glutamine---fructose-6-phosphate transaminase (isomerizing)
MCGIVAVLSRQPVRPAPTSEEVLEPLDAAVARLQDETVDLAGRLDAAADLLEPVDVALRGVPGVLALVGHDDLVAAVTGRLDVLDATSAAIDAEIERQALVGAALEAVNAAAVRLRDVLWALRRDRLRTAHEVALLAGRDAATSAVAAFWSVQVVLSALDRLEVRGRDSAGIHLLVSDHGLDLASPAIDALLHGRTDDLLFTSGSVRTPAGHLAFVYKAAAEIGELGDNTRALRAAIQSDGLLHLALASPTARVQVLSHTRWASVGIISEANAHPLIHEEDGGPAGPYVAAALNGDVDNHADLKAAEGLCIPPEVTTDAKVIPSLVSRRALTSPDLAEAFRRTVASFEGSVAIAAASATDPDELLLALRGSGQALYVGLAEDAYFVASEPYGVGRGDAHVPAHGRRDAGRPGPALGQPRPGLVLDGRRAGTVEGIRAPLLRRHASCR